MNAITPLKGETGGALLEFAFLLAVLLPVGFGVAAIGKLTDMKQTAEQASRYSAWEATVYSRQALAGQQATTLDERFFSATDTPFVSTTASRQTSTNASNTPGNPLWGSDQAGARGLRKLGAIAREANSTVSADYDFDTGKAKAALISGKIAHAAGRPLARFSGNSWDIVADGLLRSSIEVPVQKSGFLAALQDNCNQAANQNSNSSSVCMNTAGVILADGWGASGDAQVVSRVRSLVPGSTLNRIGKKVGPLLGSLVFPELDPLDKAFGHVDMSVLPRYAKP